MLTFDDFVRAVHGWSPHPWQARLASELHEIDVLHAPTSAGKTGLLDVWLWRLASEAGRPATERQTPLRLSIVIDRRIVVDSITEHASKLLRALNQPALSSVRDALLSYGGHFPLVVSRLRGGVAADTAWMEQPEQPSIIVSTVDQVGSRLLFRGYGASRRRWPIEAGLLGNDTMIVVDEAHLSGPFVQTLKRVKHLRARSELNTPWRVIEMSATAKESGGRRFIFTEADWATPTLKARLCNPKKARLVQTENGKLRTLVNTMTEVAQKLPGEKIAVIANTIAVARAIHQKLARVKDADVILLIGRTRESERQHLLDVWLPRLRSGGAGVERRTYVVATQTIEVGADLDFDALVTQIAPLSALIQRLGRVNRLGRLDESEAVIVSAPVHWKRQDPEEKDTKDTEEEQEKETKRATAKTIDNELKAKAKLDPVYAGDSYRAWDWLQDSATDDEIDLSPRAVDTLLLTHPEIPVEAAPRAPELSFRDISRLSQTGLAHPDDIAPWLHGPEASRDVSIVWREDVHLDRVDRAIDALLAVPPIASEAVEVPIWTMRAWLEGRKAQATSDAGAQGGEATGKAASPREGLVFRPDANAGERVTRVWPNEVCVGDILVVPSVYGGLDEFGWAPDSVVPVKDVASEAYEARGLTRRRITPATIDDEDVLEGLRDYLVLQSESEWRDGDDIDAAREALCEALAIQGWWRRGDTLGPYPGGVIVRRGRVHVNEDSLLIGVGEIGLAAHLADVRGYAMHSARALGLSDELIADCSLAAVLHDIGKADARMQAILGARGGQLLAKSAGGEDDISRHSIGLPRGWRHEMISAEMLRDDDGHNPGLVRHLVATHHGYCRPLPPPVDHGDVPCEYDGRRRTPMTTPEWLSQWDTLTCRFGPWGLAYLEAIVRLADWRASREPQVPDEMAGGSRLTESRNSTEVAADLAL